MVSHIESDCDQLHFLRLSIVPKSVQNFVGNAFGDKISTSTIVSQVEYSNVNIWRLVLKIFQPIDIHLKA